MYQSRSLSRHFVVADAAPLIYGTTREINYCFPQSLFCLYLPRRPLLPSLLFFGSWWSVGNGAFLLENVMRNKAHAWNANIFKTKYCLGSAKKQFGIMPPTFQDRYVSSPPPHPNSCGLRALLNYRIYFQGFVNTESSVCKWSENVVVLVVQHHQPVALVECM